MAYLPGVGRELVKAAMDAPFLEREEEKRLAVAWKDHKDTDALDKLASAHMRLVIALAVRFRHYGLPVADLVQEGHVGLLEAAARFAPERDVRFSTYATWWIRASIQDYVLRNWSIVRGGTSSSQKALFFNLRRLRAKLAHAPQSEAGDAFQAIAGAIGVSRADVELMNSRLAGSDVSLNSQLVEDDSSTSAERMDFLVDDRPLPDEVVEDRVDSDRRARWLADALKLLSERELRIVQERRLSESLVTLESLGDRLGISKERVRQIENRALCKLRKALTKAQETPETAAAAE
ncbi:MULTISPECIES: RNA polymerase factor sigma-32 [Methylosinus]|uniref:RNA polymerase factor sigma-32 n=1 Tax=Methylosinus TaxID=425 RepID=UPI00036E705F|nr:RNA polymerase factor sigma-32 [Methylosinus sp. LW4]